MYPHLRLAINDWYLLSPKKSVPIKELWELFIKETKLEVSYNYFLKTTNKITKVQSIKTGGYYARFTDFIQMTVNRSFNFVRFDNTISIDEKPFVPKKFFNKNLRVHASFRGKATAQFLQSTNPLKNLIPYYLLCAISCEKVVLFHINDNPINSQIFNSFIEKVSQEFPQNQRDIYFLFDNATFHNVDKKIEEDLNNNKIYITKTIKLGCFTNPIEEFFSLVQYYFLKILYKRIIYLDTDINKEEYLLFIKKSVRFASKACNYKLIFARAGLL